MLLVQSGGFAAAEFGGVFPVVAGAEGVVDNQGVRKSCMAMARSPAAARISPRLL